MISMTTIKYHTYLGQEHPIGDTYDVDESEVDNLVGQGLVVRNESAPVAAEQDA